MTSPDTRGAPGSRPPFLVLTEDELARLIARLRFRMATDPAFAALGAEGLTLERLQTELAAIRAEEAAVQRVRRARKRRGGAT